MDKRRRLPSPGTILGALALIVALSSVAGALPGRNTVNSGDIKNNQVKDKDIADVKFKPLTLVNGYTAYSPPADPTNPPGVAKDGFGFVHFQGAIDGSAATSSVAFRLPAAYRPPRTVTLPLDSTGQTNRRAFIMADGAVALQTSAVPGDFASLEGLTFKAK